MHPRAQQFTSCLLLAGLALAPAATAQVIVDNDDGAPAYVETGAWSSSGSPGYNNGTYRFASPGGSKTATWTADLPNAGAYEVFVWYRPGSNRTTSTQYRVHAADQVHTAIIDQTAGGYAWESLGTFTFDAGPATLVLDAGTSTGGTAVIADAVRFGADSACPVTPPVATEVAPGVWHAEWVLPAPQVLDVLMFDLADRRLAVELGFAHHQRMFASREVTSQIAARYDTPAENVIGAINASHFDAGLFIHGMQMAGGNLVDYPTQTWPKEAYVLQANGEAFDIRNPTGINPIVRFEDGTERQVDVFNDACTTNTLAIHTPDWAPTTSTGVNTAAVIVEQVSYPWRLNKRIGGVITDIRTGADASNCAIPPDGFVLTACPGAEADLLAHAVVGAPISARIELDPPELVNARVICGGASGTLVRDGAPYPAGWNYGHAPVRHPRTVVAWDGTQHWFVTCDGRQSGHSVGMTYAELADFLVNCLQVDGAVNLDGGGSTTMVVNGSVVNCPSDGATTPCTGNERAVPNALLLLGRNATTDGALVDPFPSAGRLLAWDDKFSINPVVPKTPGAPGGDGYALEVCNSAGSYETASIGGAADVNCTTTAVICCEYRPDVAADGFERVGIFARDDGNANFDADVFGGGNCYALTFDTDTGRIRAGVVTDGVFYDYLDAAPLYAPSTAWREFQIRCDGDRIRFSVDGQTIADVVDDTHPSGRAGIGHHAYFTTDGLAHGAIVEHFDVYCIDVDYDNDGDVDMQDVTFFLFCYQGPDTTFAPGHFCAEKDGDGDLDVDLADFRDLQSHFGG